MPDLENRLRASLTILADEVPSSLDARAELDRRLAVRRRTHGRAQVLAAAAAVVVVAGVAVPIALNQGPDRSGVSPATSQGPPTGSEPPASLDYLEAPTPISSAGAGAELRHLALGLSRDSRLCFVVLDADERPITDPVCEPMPTWSADHVVESRSLAELATRLPMPPVLEQEVADQLVFVTAPQVVRLDVVSGDGTPVNPSGGWTSAYYWSLADFDGPSEGFGYAAYDIDNNLLEQAIT